MRTFSQTALALVGTRARRDASAGAMDQERLQVGRSDAPGREARVGEHAVEVRLERVARERARIDGGDGHALQLVLQRALERDVPPGGRALVEESARADGLGR